MKKHFTVEKIIVYLFVVIFGIFATNQSINAYKESLLVDGFQFSVDGSLIIIFINSKISSFTVCFYSKGCR